MFFSQLYLIDVHFKMGMLIHRFFNVYYAALGLAIFSSIAPNQKHLVLFFGHGCASGLGRVSASPNYNYRAGGTGGPGGRPPLIFPDLI